MKSFAILLTDKEERDLIELKNFWETRTKTEVFRKMLKLVINMKAEDKLRLVL